MSWDAESFKAGLAAGRLLWRPPAQVLGWCRGDALVTRAGTVLSTNNGFRTPYVKRYDGEAAAFIAFNDAGSQWSGGWVTVYLIAPFGMGADSAKMSVAGNYHADHFFTFEYKRKTYYCNLGHTSRYWGGSSMYTNPLGLPTMTDVQLIADVNENPGTVSNFGEIVGDFLHLR